MTATSCPPHLNLAHSMSPSLTVPRVRPCPPPPWQLSWEKVFHPRKHGDKRACGALHPCCAWEDIFNFFHIHQDRWEDAAVAGGIHDEEQEVTAGDLLCHKHPAKKRAGRRKHIPPAAKPEQLPWHHLAHSKEI